MASTASNNYSGASKALGVNVYVMLATNFYNELSVQMASAHISVGPASKLLSSEPTSSVIVQHPTPACTLCTIYR